MHFYVTDEFGLKPGISGEWPIFIAKPNNMHGRLRKIRSTDQLFELLGEYFKDKEIDFKPLELQPGIYRIKEALAKAEAVTHTTNESEYYHTGFIAGLDHALDLLLKKSVICPTTDATIDCTASPKLDVPRKSGTKYFVYYSDDYPDNGGVGFKECNDCNEALEFIEERMQQAGAKASLDNYKVIVGELCELVVTRQIDKIAFKVDGQRFGES